MVGGHLKTIIKGTVFVFSSLVIASVFGYLSKVLLARYLGPAELGLYTLALTVIYLFSAFTISGMGTSITYFFSKERKNEKLKNEFLSTISYFSFTLIFIVSLAVVLYPKGIATLFGNLDLMPLVPLISIFIVLFGSSGILFAILRGAEKAKTYSILNSLIPLLFFILVFVFKISFAYYALLAFILSYVAIDTILFISVFRSVKFTAPNFTLLKKVISFSIVLFLVEVLFSLRRWIDVWMLSWLSTTVNIGFYTVAISSAFAFGIILSAVNFLYLPVSTKLLVKDSLDELRRMYKKLCFIITLILAPFTVLLILFASQFIILVFGMEYLPAVVPFQILMMATFINSIFGPNWTNLVAQEEKKNLIFVSIVAVIINVIFNYFLIMYWGIVGAAIATSISIVVWNILTSYLVWIKQNMTFYSADMLKSIAISVVMVVPFVILVPVIRASLLTAIIFSFGYLVLYAVTINFTVIRIKDIFDYIFTLKEH